MGLKRRDETARRFRQAAILAPNKLSIFFEKNECAANFFVKTGEYIYAGANTDTNAQTHRL
jgi:hypothetical protein